MPSSPVQMLDRRLRSEQDAEYQRALAADQDRERQKHEAAQAEAAEKQAARQAAEHARCVWTCGQLVLLSCILRCPALCEGPEHSQCNAMKPEAALQPQQTHL